MAASSTYVRELYALTKSVKKWRQYLLGNTFKIFTDHKSLKTLMTQTIQTPEQQKWLTKLMGYSYEICYKPGRENLVADALSRIPTPTTPATCLALSFPSTAIINQLQDFFHTNAVGIQWIHKVDSDPSLLPQFTIKADLVYFKGRLFVPEETGLRALLLQEFHATPIGGHSGVKATLARLAATFYWPNMHSEVKTYIQKCTICRCNKYSTQAPYGLLQPLATPTQVWEDISMDFITHLPASAHKTVIWVIVDRLTKFAHFISLPTSYSASSLATIFLTEIFRLHGVPRSIVSDRDKIFISSFWKELFKKLGTNLAFSSAYHPQTDGQTEVLNRCLETYLRCFVSDTPQKWSSYLALAEYWYNSSFHSAIGMSPFEALYGPPPPSIIGYVQGDSKIASLDELLTHRMLTLKVIKENLLRARNRMVQQANKKRIDKVFAVNDLVYLKLQPYRQLSLRQHHSQKLAKCFYGPFRVIRRIGTVAYELELPDSARIHSVFHVSLLKPFYGDPSTPVTPLPLPDVVTEEFVPLQLLGSRFHNTTHGHREELLIRWAGQTREEATWELKDVFEARFPMFNLEDKINLKTGSDDTLTDAETSPVGNEYGPNKETGPIAIHKPKRDRKIPGWLRAFK